MPGFNVVHRITPLVQLNPNDCWAAAIAMAVNMSVQRVKAIAAFNGVTISTDGSLAQGDIANLRLLGRGFHMRPHAVSRIPAIARLAQLMRSRPIVVLGRIRHRRGIIPHALTIHRLVGGGRADNTEVGFVDPFQRGTHLFMYSDFANRSAGPVPDPHFILA
ncbi:MAG: hypothetical protein H8E44_29950 [Planctomycetes bacterium]|nr:hypothetical protein [Planctomycetota bacterium]MBL7041346.1 hypothetical protein [Pirellulaceae bacterium]